MCVCVELEERREAGGLLRLSYMQLSSVAIAHTSTLRHITHAMSWEQQYLKHSQPVRVFSLQRDAIEGYDTDADVHVDDDDNESEVTDFEQIQLCEDSPELATLRTRAYRDAWKACEADIRSVLQNIYNDTIAQLHTFVKTVPTKARHGRRALFTGVILGANRTISSALSGALQRSDGEGHIGTSQNCPSSGSNSVPTTRIARISSRGCLNKRSALRTLIQAVIASDTSSEDTEADISRPTTRKKQSMASMDDMETLVAWYESKHPNQSTAPRLVICLEEFESFDSIVLTDLIEILSSYSNRIPFILLLSISTSIDAIHNLLPRSTSELLRIKTFTVTPNIETFHTLLYEVFIKRNQVISPGSKTFTFLRNTFLDLNQSIDGVIAKLNYMFLAHFYGNPYSVFCIGISNDMSTEEELDFFGSIIPSLRTLSSFQKFIEKMINEGRIKRDKNLMRMARILLEDDEELLRYIDTARKEKELYTKNLPQAWILFDILQSSWLEGRLSTETLLNDYFTGNLSKRTSLSCRNLLNARDDVILDFLRRTQESVHLVSLDILDLRNSLEELEDLIQGGTRQVGLTRLVNGNIHGSIAKSDGDKRFTALVKDLSEGLDRYFKSHLKPFTELTFHEIWYPEVHRVMRNAFHPYILDQVQASLITPSSRLPLHLIDDSETLPTNENLDVCKAYKLVSEAGKLVNLADWFGAFEVALEEEEDDIGENDDGKETVTVESSSSILRSRRRKVISTRSSRNGGDSLREDQNSRDANGSHKNGMDVDGNEDDSEDEETARIRNHQARFLAAAGDLAYLGYIQPTKRKVEHVARVVF